MGVAGDSEAHSQRFVEIQAELLARWPETRLEPSLDRIAALAELLGDPQRAYPVIQVAGTNGKSSTARIIESLLRAFGLRTGLFTSPHLTDIRERIGIDGRPISVERFVDVYDDIAPYLGIVDDRFLDTPLSYFEVLTAMGYAAFADAPVGVAVVETGMGGTWDATNVADGVVAVITPIDIDHTDYLGTAVATIAAEKAGIIKPGCAAVIAEQERDALDVLVAAARQMEARTALEGLHFGVAERLVALGGQMLTLRGLGGEYAEVFLPLFGEH